MGAENAVTKEYLSDARRFSEIFNNELFEGRRMIRPECLTDMDPAELAQITEVHKELKFLERYRDCLKVHDGNTVLVILGVENQQYIDYAMPVRMLLYDALNYENQRRGIMNMHEKKKDLTGDEYLGKFSKTDKIIPVISLLVYWGSEPWSGAKSLWEILDIPEELLQYKDRIADYRMNMLDVHNMENLEQYDGELKALLGFVKYQKDKAALLEFVEDNREVFQSIDTKTARAIRVLANAKELEPILKKENPDKEGIDMCQALQDLIIQGEKTGVKLGVDNLFRLMDLMEADGMEDKIPLLRKDPKFLQEMYEKYHLNI